MNRRATVLLLVFFISTGIAPAQRKHPKQKSDAFKPETKEVKIARAVSAAPPSVSDGARVLDRDENGAETVLRDGGNGFTCFPGHLGVVGDGAYCARSEERRVGKEC